MTWFPAFSNPPRLLPLTAAIIAALSMPALAQVQTADTTTAGSAIEKTTTTEPPASRRQGKSEKNCAETAEAETITGSPDRVMYLYNDTEITKCDTAIASDHAVDHIVEDQIEAYGQVRMTRFGDLYVGDELKLRMDTGLGYMLDPTYHLVSNNAQGVAKRIDFETEDRAKAINATYSTCDSPNPDWYLKAPTIDFDHATATGVAYQSVVYFENLPILWAPEMPFPLSDERRSGFLAPTPWTSNRGGPSLEIPYYFNIAPNRDMTLTTDLIPERGVQLASDMRYMGTSYLGETRFEYLPNDRLTDTNRWAFNSIQSQNLAPGWGLSWNVNAASDDNYPNDFTHSITNASQRLLGRDLSLTYTEPFWSMALRTTGYQVLQDPLAPITQPYDRLPQFLAHAGKQDVHGFDWSVDFEAVRFWENGMTEGDRYTFTPRLSYPIILPQGFFTPKISWNFTRYDLQDQAFGVPGQITRAVPTFSLDTGLIFERDTSFLGDALTQTLEPRLFYLNTPYRNQSRIPNFDTADADITFSQLFSENRFIGGDRIGDANQLTAALTTRFIESNGEERARFAIGQRFSFEQEKVTLPTDLPNTNSNSDLLFSALGRFSKLLSAGADIDYSESSHSLSQTDVIMRWQPGPKKLLNLQYLRDIPDAIEQFSASGQWPVLQRWYAVGRADYSITNHDVTQALLGVEYKADCWVIRFGAQHTQTATNVSSTSEFFQLELNGLAPLGSNALEAIRLNVPGYQAVNQAPKASYPY